MSNNGHYYDQRQSDTLVASLDFHRHFLEAVFAARLEAMRLEDLDYDLPAAQIAQYPAERRDGSRLLLVDRQQPDCKQVQLTDTLFLKLPSLLRGDELMVFNNARVIPARLFGRRAKATSGTSATLRQPEPSGEVEVFLSRE